MSCLFELRLLGGDEHLWYNTGGVTVMDIKKRPNHKIYIQVLRQMSPEKRLKKAFELSEFAKQLFIHRLHERFPDLSDEEFKKLLLERLNKCHNRNY